MNTMHPHPQLKRLLWNCPSGHLSSICPHWVRSLEKNYCQGSHRH